ncbi:hypothetical protein [Rhizobium sp. C4]|uniref:hypothetical protein n=1 Tax=Rhizobium sp. C4 TaxID=1349800 RepID=UPI001E487BA9|nr:hypothetical protein [Rhizobium sp. C4]MCD2174475.1 hypothetical protein [Rhizobium sp. C4]
MASIESTAALSQSKRGERAGPLSSGKSRLGLAVLIAFVIILLFHLVNLATSYTDYVGPDNDDAMRLVEVRDFLGGQGWFDLMQYRLGPAPGTLMHWSRFVDLPIAALISFFGLFLSPRMAEATALFVWPVSLALPVLYFIGLGARRIGGERAMFAAVPMAVLFLLQVHRFEPGGIDHHNVQMALIAIVAAGLVDPLHRASSYALSGLAAAIALAVGAETTPLIGVAAVIIALRWAFLGQPYAAAARSFGLSFAVLTAAAYVATVPRALYTTVTCDNLSYGFLVLTVFGGAALFGAASLASRAPMSVRLAILACIGVGAAGVTLAVMPQCLQNPLASLDPLLKEIWLDRVTEAQSVFMQAKLRPETVGGFYFVGFIAMVVSAWRVKMGDRAAVHLVLFVLLSGAWAISLIQVRGTTFPQMLSILPLAVLVAELHAIARRDPDSVIAGLPFAIMTLASIPAFWFVVGFLASEATGSEKSDKAAAAGEKVSICVKETNLNLLNRLPKGMIAAPSNMGSPILRFTGHSVLAAPYHRNPNGMLVVLHAGLATPEKAEAILGDVGTDYVVFCPGDGELKELAQRAPDGLAAALLKDRPPAFLKDVTPSDATNLKIYRLVR